MVGIALVLVVAAVAVAIGIGLGIVIAPRLGRLLDRADADAATHAEAPQSEEPRDRAD